MVSKIWKKVTLCFGIGALATSLPITAMVIMHNNKIKYGKNDFKSIDFHGIHFNSVSEILNYINKNSDELETKAGRTIYTVKVGSDYHDFQNYKGAMDFIKGKIKTKEVYLKPGIEKIKSASIGADAFIETSSTRKYVVFAKYNSRFDSGDPNKKLEHSYTYALLPQPSDSESTKQYLLANIDEARLEAAKSYIQVHTAYLFNDIYFNTLNDVRQYIILHRSEQFDRLASKTKLSILDTQKGLLKFKRSLNSDALSKDHTFRNKVENLATPIFNVGKKDKPRWVNLNQDSINEIAANIDERDLEYVKIDSNNDEVTQIVDMDAATPNGNIFGNYFFKTGQGMNGVTDQKNWDNSDQDVLESATDISDIAILKSVINYVLNSKSLKNILDLMDITKLPDENETQTFLEFISLPKFNKGRKSYKDDLYKLIGQLSRGARFDHLNAIIATHSYLINKMIRNGENIKDIVTVSKYFNSMAEVMDSILAPLIAPFLVNEKSQNFKFNYLTSAFHFYDDNMKGKGINFQQNPYSYYRRLIGHKGDDNKSTGNKTSYKQREIFFKLLKASMGLNAIMMNGLRHNQVVFSKWENGVIGEIKMASRNNSKPDINKISFKTEKSNNNLWDFRFKGNSNRDLNSKEYISIWKNIESINGDLTFSDGTNDVTINSTQIERNAENYISNYQNALIKDYQVKIDKKMDEIMTTFKTGHDEKYIEKPQKNSPNTKRKIITKHIPRIKWKSDSEEKYFNINLFDFIAIPSELKGVLASGQTISTTYDGYQHLNDMLKSLTKSLENRIKDFAINVGSFAISSGMAIVAAGNSASEMLVSEGLKANKKDIAGWIIKGRASKISQMKKLSQKTTKKVENMRSKMLLKASGKLSLFGKNKKYDSPANNLIKNICSASVFGLLGESVFGEEFTKIFNDILDVSIGIAKNVIPLLGTLMGFIDSFNSSKSQVYYYKLPEDDSKLYWNGGLVESSWWGLVSNVKYSINDLKMIVTEDIVSGYSEAESGYYYNNKTYDSLAKLRYAKAVEIVEKFTLGKRFEIPKNDKVKWTLPLKGENINNTVKSDSLEELVKEMAKTAQKTEFRKDIFISSTGLSSSNNNDVFEASLKGTLNRLKKVLIIKLPKDDNEYKRPDIKFILPKPYYNQGMIVKLKPKETNDNYITFNPNISVSGNSEMSKLRTLGFNLKASDPKFKEEKERYKNYLKTLTDLSGSVDFSTNEKINKFIEKYAKDIPVQNKEVIFEEINNQGNFGKSEDNFSKASKGSYERLDSFWTERVKTIYEIQNDTGEKQYFLSKKAAVLEITKDNNYALSFEKMGRDTIKYKFNNQLFDSIDQIYRYIIHASEEGGL